MNPFLVPVGEYQWGGAVNDLAALLVTGWDFPEHIDAVRTKWDLTPVEADAALLDAHLELDNGWGQPHQEN